MIFYLSTNNNLMIAKGVEASSNRYCAIDGKYIISENGQLYRIIVNTSLRHILKNKILKKISTRNYLRYDLELLFDPIFEIHARILPIFGDTQIFIHKYSFFTHSSRHRECKNILSPYGILYTMVDNLLHQEYKFSIRVMDIAVICHDISMLYIDEKYNMYFLNYMIIQQML